MEEGVVGWGTALLWVVAAVVAVWWWAAKTRAPLPLPPSPPRGLPIIGHLHLIAGKPNPHRLLQDLAAKHGPLIMLRMGSARLLVASSPDMAREILQRQDAVFASRPRTAFAVHVFYNCKDSVLSPLGPFWRSMRMVSTTHLLTRKSIDGFKPVREQEIRALLRAVMDASRAGTQVLLRGILWRCANNIICRMAFGFQATEYVAREQGPALPDVLDDLNFLFAVFNIGDFLPWLAWLDLQGYVKRMKSVSHTLDAVFQRILDDARAARRQPHSASPLTQQPNLVDILLSLSETQKGLPGDIQITDEIIKALMLNMFVAGTETWSLTVEWALLELLNSPNTMLKLQDELESFVGKDRLVEGSDIPHLQYLQAVVKETLRLHPIVPLLVPHLSTKATQIGSYYIPPNTWTMVNVWAIHRDSNVWPDKPLEFIPERFLVDSNLDLLGHNFEFLPFSSGRRSCPGLVLGLANVHLTIASLVQAFDISCPNMLPLDTFETTGIAVKPRTPLSPFARPRLPKHVY